ncbi:cell division protein [Pseudoalteromonas luteoviolacea]|uniref:Cell division protein n=1 Tax=Pseudoalteromonas luteoviolacea TaxID=43657 RepID=A0A0C1MNU4_9GAMM|nr:ATP-binding protein [Pseudoalteromonas luteoviolacea]KID56208.1 cell division protein [Pseudoalteromonas luteoviolacea]
MDKNLLHSLETALSQSPENLHLRFTIVQAYFENNEPECAYELLKDIELGTLDQIQQPIAAKVFLAMEQPETALQTLTLTTPDINIIRSQAYNALNDLVNAKAFYEQAISDNPALEDLEYAKILRSDIIPSPADKKMKLRVISNDDTDTIEVTRVIHPPKDTITFDDVGGLDQVKKQIRKKIITPFQKPSLFSKFRKKVGGGILLYGPPGCGKTLLARATAGECNATFYNVVISDILDMYIGESERKLHAIFEQARANTPAVIFFDEIEALAAKRQHTREATSSKLVSQFLSELDGFAQDNQGVLVLGATNVPWAIDPAFRRPGRFDRVVFIAPPDQAARVEIIKGLLKDRPGGESINVEKIANQTSGFSGADLMNLIESAVDEAIDDSIANGVEVPLNQKHVNDAMNISKPTTLEWLTMARNYAKYANDAGQYDEVMAFLKKYGK